MISSVVFTGPSRRGGNKMRNKALSRFLHWWLLAAGAGLATAVPAGAA
jgi:hypothetical protein